jgi:hypothetical protein
MDAGRDNGKRSEMTQEGDERLCFSIGFVNF